MNSNSALTAIDKVRQCLEAAQTIGEIKTIRDKAEAVRVYAHNARLGLLALNRAAELKLRAERKAGSLLSELKLRGGDRKSNRHHERLKLADLSISQNQSRRWQLAASVPEKQFERFLRETEGDGKEISTAALLRLARSRAADAKRQRPKEDPQHHTRGSNGSSRIVAQKLVTERRTVSGNVDQRQHRIDKTRRCRRTSQAPLADDSMQIVAQLLIDATETVHVLQEHRIALANLIDATIADRSASDGQARLLTYYLSQMGDAIAHVKNTLNSVNCQIQEDDSLSFADLQMSAL